MAFFKARQRQQWSREGTVIEVSLPTVNVYNVEFAELPNECYGGGLAKPAPLPASIPMDKIMSNIAPWWQKLSPTSPSRTSICYPCFSEKYAWKDHECQSLLGPEAQNLDFKGWSEQARNLWFKDFKSQCSRAVIQDTFWFCISDLHR